MGRWDLYRAWIPCTTSPWLPPILLWAHLISLLAMAMPSWCRASLLQKQAGNVSLALPIHSHCSSSPMFLPTAFLCSGPLAPTPQDLHPCTRACPCSTSPVWQMRRHLYALMFPGFTDKCCLHNPSLHRLIIRTSTARKQPMTLPKDVSRELPLLALSKSFPFQHDRGVLFKKCPNRDGAGKGTGCCGQQGILLLFAEWG